MANGVIVPLSYQAKNIDALVYNVINKENDIDNGVLLVKGNLSSDSDKQEVYEVSKPATTSTGLLMAYSPEDNIIEGADGTMYKVGDLNPKNFTNKKGIVFNAIKLQVGDTILASVDCFSTAPTSGSKVATVDTNGKLVAAASSEGTGTKFNIVKESYITIADSFPSQRTKAYVIEVVNN